MDGLIGTIVILYPIILLLVTVSMLEHSEPKPIFVVSTFVWFMISILCFGCWLLSKGI